MHLHCEYSHCAQITNYRYNLLFLAKISQVLNLLGFICIQVSSFSYHSRGSYFSSIAMTGFWLTGILLFFYIFHVCQRFYKIPWLKIEMIYCALWTILYLIAASLAAAFGTEAYSAAAVIHYSHSQNNLNPMPCSEHSYFRGYYIFTVLRLLCNGCVWIRCVPKVQSCQGGNRRSRNAYHTTNNSNYCISQ